ASVWGPLEENPAARVAHDEAGRMFPDDPPRFLLVVPYGFDSETLRSLALAAGFAKVAVTHVTFEGVSPPARGVATGFAKGTPLSAEILERGGDLDAAVAAIEAALEAEGAGKPFRSPLSAYVLSAS